MINDDQLCICSICNTCHCGNCGKKPFTFNWSSKIGLLFFILISRTVSYFPGRQDKVSKSGTIQDNLGLMPCMD